MNTMAPARTAELHAYRVRLTTGPAAAGEARGQVQAAIYAWSVPVDTDVAVLLTSELVTNAIKHGAGGPVRLGIQCTRDQLRVEVHDTSPSLPVLMNTPVDATDGRGLVLVASLSAEWGSYRTPAGKAVYFTLAFWSDPAGDSGARAQGNGRIGERTGRAPVITPGSGAAPFPPHGHARPSSLHRQRAHSHRIRRVADVMHHFPGAPVSGIRPVLTADA